jgi:hypothetical protein
VKRGKVFYCFDQKGPTKKRIPLAAMDRRMAQPQMAGEIVSLAAITSPCQKGATIA